mmetsp:Transcript_63373/g.196324  ORF Transcript_63373/g.196324 Transcript_63373/m.196324 type:complete len:277 (-) Transcript_63373:49-879(-)
MRCSESTSRAWLSSSCGTALTAPEENASRKRSKAAKRMGITLSRSTWFKSRHPVRQQAARSRRRKPLPSAPVEPGGARPCISRPFSTALTPFKACARLSHFEDCREAATIWPKASLTLLLITSGGRAKFRESSNSEAGGDGDCRKGGSTCGGGGDVFGVPAAAALPFASAAARSPSWGAAAVAGGDAGAAAGSDPLGEGAAGCEGEPPADGDCRREGASAPESSASLPTTRWTSSPSVSSPGASNGSTTEVLDFFQKLSFRITPMAGPAGGSTDPS